MKMVLACRELGFDCGFVAMGDDFSRLVDDCARHCRIAHGMNEKQVREILSR
jgi:predicted small metal-binding protein